jgi:CheY-like chemotaxis protein
MMNGKKTVLIVDDDPDLRQLLTTLLASEDIEVEDAENGEEALEAIHKHRPDLILLDMRMPIMNGWELCEVLDREGDRPPVIVLTAAANPAQRAAEVHAEGWLGKPFDRRALRAQVGRFVELH